MWNNKCQKISEMSSNFAGPSGASKRIKNGGIESENSPVKKIKLEDHMMSRMSSDIVEQFGASKGMKNEGTESKNGPVMKQKFAKEYDALGLKTSLHGIIYQLKLLTLFLRRGLNNQYSFTLATEMVAAEKFDDIVFGYTNKNGEDVCRFIQVKHKENENEKITISDLLTEKDDDFSLKKYFISYCKIKRNPIFEGYKLEDLVICTNIDLDEQLKGSFEKISHRDNILHFEFCRKEFQRYRINLGVFSEEETLRSILYRTSELSRLANVLAFYLYRNKVFDLGDDLLKAYHAVLGEKVIRRVTKSDGVVGKFRNEFICGEQSPVFERFRKAFYEEYLVVSKKKLDEEKFWEKMKDKEMKISSGFGKKFNLKNPELVHPEIFAGKIADLINTADERTVNIYREKGRYGGVVKQNIDKLGGYVFIKRGDESNNEYYFSSEFLNEDNKLPANLDVFRDELKIKLRNIEFPEMNRYKFRILKFETCEEGQLNWKPSLPDDYVDDEDIDGFLKSLVFSVNQPNEKELDSIIEDEIGKDFNLIDSELLVDKLQKDMMDWMKKKKGTFITNEKGCEFFEQISQKTSKLVLIGPTLLYLAKMQQFKISFQDDLIALQDFLKSKYEQIFNLMCSHGTIFGSIKVIQTLKKIDVYQKNDSYIFMSLQNVLFIEEHVIDAFTSGTCNLLIIECKAKENIRRLKKLYDRLATNLEIYENKKIILITLKNDTFAQKFREDVLWSNRYKEIEDVKNNFNDLSEQSQKKILMEAKVVFQEKEMNLGSVLDNKSTHMLSGEVLSMLINDEKIQIGDSLMDSKYEDVKDYFVERTFGRCLSIKKVILKEAKFLVIEDNQKKNIEKLHEYSGKDIVVVSSTGDNFRKLCEKFDSQNIHWLKKKGNQLIWQKSRGDLTEVRKFVDTREQSITTYKPNEISNITDVSDKVFLLAAEPGMGKSVILTHLALETQFISPCIWIIRTNLADYSTNFYEWKENSTKINVLEAMKFLCEIANFQNFKYSEEDEKTKKMIHRALIEENVEIYPTRNVKGLSFLEIKLFVRFFHQGRVIVLFDGFDEISPDFNELVVKLMKVLKDTKVRKIWLTTRPYDIQSEPENHLSTFSYVLMPFIKEEQQDFLMKFWSKNLESEEAIEPTRAHIFINELLNQFSESINDVEDRKFLSIPLQIYMIATVFSEEFERFYSLGSEELSEENIHTLRKKLDLITLYEDFIKTMFDIQRGKDHSAFHHDKHKPAVKRETNRQLEEFKENNKKLAVYSMLKKNQLENVLSKKELEEVHVLMRNISNAVKKTGMISRIINNNPKESKEAADMSGDMSNMGRNRVMITEIIDNKPVFIHRTFAEYFAAKFVWDKFESIQCENFKNDFIQNIVKGVLIKNDFIQVCKFLQLIAKNSFSSKNYFHNVVQKMEMLFVELAKQTKEYGPRNATLQSTKVLLGIIELTLADQNEGNYLNMKKNFKMSAYKPLEPLLLKLLCVCAEMGYIGLAKTLKIYVDARFPFEWPRKNRLSYSKLLFERLEKDEWNYSPLWIAAENGHLSMVTFLIRSLAYDITWKDKHGANLIQRIFSTSAFNVLKSCIELKIITGEPFKNLHDVGQKKLPIYEALKAFAPSEVIKLLMEKTDVRLINNFADCDLKKTSVKEHMSLLLIQYDTELTEFVIGKGIDLSSSMNVLLQKFTSESLCNPTYDLIHGCGNFTSPFFNSDKEFFNVFPTIELLLNSGDAAHRTNSLQCAERVYYIHQLLNEVHTLYKRRNRKKYDPRNLILKLIIDVVCRFPGFKGFKFIIKPEEVSILFNCNNQNHNSKMGKFIKNCIDKSPYFKGFRCIPRGNDGLSIRSCTPEHQDDKTYPTFKRNMMEMFFGYHNGTWRKDSVNSAIDQLKSYVANMEKIFKIFKKHHQRNVTDIFYTDGSSPLPYENELKQLKNYEEKKCQYESLNKLVKGLLSGVLYLYSRQDYEINNAVNEISDEIMKLEKVMNKMLEKKNVSYEYDADKLLDMLDLKSNVATSEKVQKLAFEINNKGGLDLLLDVYLLLNEIGQKKLMKTLQSMCRFSDQSSRIFNLFRP